MSKPELRWDKSRETLNWFDGFVNGEIMYCVYKSMVLERWYTSIGQSTTGLDGYFDTAEAAKAACERHWQEET